MAKYEANSNGGNYIATPAQALRETLANLIDKERDYAQYEAKDDESYEVYVELGHFDTMISRYEEAIRVLENQYSPQIFIPKDNKEDK